uniref:Uncharacterized protein n=1 Tax=Panagrolaimus davidi TaxID=227884 RepID=A0A914Q926_9BILA
MESISQLPQLQNAEYLVYVMNNENEQLIFAIVNFQTGKTVLRILGPSGDFEKSMNGFSTRFDENCKALILNIFEYKSDDLNIKHYNAFKEKVDSLKIPYYFISSNDFVYTRLLIFANITANYNETITVICVTKAEYIIT